MNDQELLTRFPGCTLSVAQLRETITKVGSCQPVAMPSGQEERKEEVVTRVKREIPKVITYPYPTTVINAHLQRIRTFLKEIGFSAIPSLEKTFEGWDGEDKKLRDAILKDLWDRATDHLFATEVDQIAIYWLVYFSLAQLFLHWIRKDPELTAIVYDRADQLLDEMALYLGHFINLDQEYSAYSLVTIDQGRARHQFDRLFYWNPNKCSVDLRVRATFPWEGMEDLRTYARSQGFTLDLICHPKDLDDNSWRCPLSNLHRVRAVIALLSHGQLNDAVSLHLESKSSRDFLHFKNTKPDQATIGAVRSGLTILSLQNQNNIYLFLWT